MTHPTPRGTTTFFFLSPSSPAVTKSPSSLFRFASHCLSSEPTHPTGHEGILPSEPQQQLHTESLRELLERIEREDQEKIGAAERAFESGEEIQEHIHSVTHAHLPTHLLLSDLDQVLRLKKYRCVVFMYGDEKNPEDGDGYAVIKMLQRCCKFFSPGVA